MYSKRFAKKKNANCFHPNATQRYKISDSKNHLGLFFPGDVKEKERSGTELPTVDVPLNPGDGVWIDLERTLDSYGVKNRVGA